MSDVHNGAGPWCRAAPRGDGARRHRHALLRAVGHAQGRLTWRRTASGALQGAASCCAPTRSSARSSPTSTQAVELVEPEHDPAEDPLRGWSASTPRPSVRATRRSPACSPDADDDEVRRSSAGSLSGCCARATNARTRARLRSPAWRQDHASGARGAGLLGTQRPSGWPSAAGWASSGRTTTTLFAALPDDHPAAAVCSPTTGLLPAGGRWSGPLASTSTRPED